jgi:hypothetical protein
MVRRVAYLAAVCGLVLGLAGCASSLIGGFAEQRPSWRQAAEEACMVGHQFASSPYIVPAKEIDGRGTCGLEYPLKVSAFESGAVAVGPDATLGCPITDAVEGWLQDSIQPAAIAWFGEPVVALKQISDYSCRTRNNVHGAKLSEHAFGNALDVAGFVFASGRVVTVRKGWRGDADEQGFLREVAATGCQRFATFLGPGARYHGDHFHVDLARHGKAGTSRYCKPMPMVTPPERTPYLPQAVAGRMPVAPDTTGSIRASGRMSYSAE